MTTVKDLIATLQTRNPDAHVYLMTTRKQPYAGPRLMRSASAGRHS
jgi:hypothetical protein